MIFLLFSTTLSGLAIVGPVSADDSVKLWALIVDGFYLNSAGDAAYMYHVLHDHYNFHDDDICYLTNWGPAHGQPPIPGTDKPATKANMNWSITTWLYDVSDSNDIIFIFFSNHGVGYNTVEGKLAGGRIESPSDEKKEHYIENQWKGVDEGLEFPEEDKHYWDDELKEDLNYLASHGKYGKLLFVCFACFSGGFIDDLSAPNRIMMTSANETYKSRMVCSGRYFQNEWAARFTDALHGEEAYWNPDTYEIVNMGVPVDADWSNDGNVSLWEAWDYAWKNDTHRQQGLETPWLDDNGNDLPNYENGSETEDSGDGLLSMETYFGSGNLKSADINDDAIVNILDMAIVGAAYGSEPGDPNWNPLADLNNDTIVNMLDLSHVALHYGKWYPNGSGSKGGETDSALVEGTISLFVHPNKNQVFSVDVNVASITDLYAYEFKVYYDKSVLSCVDIKLPKGHFLEPTNDPNNIYTAKMEYDNSYNATHGRIWVAVTLLGDEPGKGGDGTLVTITFTAKAKVKGTPILTLQDVILVKAKSLNSPTGPSTPP